MPCKPRKARARPRDPIHAEPRGERAAIVVDDNGPGVPESDRQHIFDPYVTHREGGTGLGLAIVRKIVIDHGGDVTVGQSPQGGARFTVELPSGSTMQKKDTEDTENTEDEEERVGSWNPEKNPDGPLFERFYLGWSAVLFRTLTS
jgi:hypothetical protein